MTTLLNKRKIDSVTDSSTDLSTHEVQTYPRGFEAPASTLLGLKTQHVNCAEKRRKINQEYIETLNLYRKNYFISCRNLEILYNSQVKNVCEQKNVPSPRLVGIELNPGPPKVTIEVKTPAGMVPNGTPNNTKKKRRQRRKNNNNNNNKNLNFSNRGPVQTHLRTNRKQVLNQKFSHRIVGEYIDTINDPFEFGPVRLGFGTMTPSNLATVYCRGSLISSSVDGSFTIFLIPAVGSGGSGSRGGVYTSTTLSNKTATVYNYQAWANRVPVQAQGYEARVVSGGIRTCPLVSATNTPGIMFAQSVASDTFTNLNTTNTETFSQTPYARWCQGNQTVAVTVRPSDSDSFNFHTDIGGGYQSDNHLTWSSVPVISGTGFPFSTTVYYEAILNLEFLPNRTAAFANYVGSEVIPNEPTLSDYIPSIDQLWTYAKELLEDPVDLTDSFYGSKPSSSGNRSFHPPYHMTKEL